jgi:hypothetical protein
VIFYTIVKLSDKMLKQFKKSINWRWLAALSIMTSLLFLGIISILFTYYLSSQKQTSQTRAAKSEKAGILKQNNKIITSQTVSGAKKTSSNSCPASAPYPCGTICCPAGSTCTPNGCKVITSTTQTSNSKTGTIDRGENKTVAKGTTRCISVAQSCIKGRVFNDSGQCLRDCPSGCDARKLDCNGASVACGEGITNNCGENTSVNTTSDNQNQSSAPISTTDSDPPIITIAPNTNSTSLNNDFKLDSNNPTTSSLISSPTPQPTTLPTVTPTPEMIKTTFTFKIRLQGINKLPSNNQVLSAQLHLVDNQKRIINLGNVNLAFNSEGGNIWQFTSEQFTVTKNVQYSIFLKPQKHLRKKIADNIIFKSGENNFDYANIILSSGDLPNPQQDGIIDSSDISFIRNNLGTKEQDKLKIGDLNLDGIIDSQDYSLIIRSLTIKYDDNLTQLKLY